MAATSLCSAGKATREPPAMSGTHPLRYGGQSGALFRARNLGGTTEATGLRPCFGRRLFLFAAHNIEHLGEKKTWNGPD